MELHKLLEGNKPILLDGGMGTMLQAKGLKPGEPPELAALTHPDWLLDIHRAYVQAGAQIISASTFAPPPDCPNTVTLSGSPPKAAILS